MDNILPIFAHFRSFFSLPVYPTGLCPYIVPLSAHILTGLCQSSPTGLCPSHLTDLCPYILPITAHHILPISACLSYQCLLVYPTDLCPHILPISAHISYRSLPSYPAGLRSSSKPSSSEMGARGTVGVRREGGLLDLVSSGLLTFACLL